MVSIQLLDSCLLKSVGSSTNPGDRGSPFHISHSTIHSFLSKVTQKLNPQGYLITYSSSAAVRKTLRNLGLEIFTIKPSFKNRTFWSQGTVAIAKFDKNKFQPNFNFEQLSVMEEEHLLTKASIPYRDKDLNSSKEDIIKKRLDEQLFSNLLSTKKWREKWGMTKLSVKS